MSYTTIETTHGMTIEQWSDMLYTEYLGEFPFQKLMGTGEDAIIQVKEELTKGPGDAITFTIVDELDGEGVTGLNRLKGNEEQMNFFTQRVTVDEFRHGIVLKGKMSQQRTAFNLRNTGKDRLKNWSRRKLENDVITALSDTTSGRVRGRYLYGAADSNWNATEATAKATIDNTNDKLTASVISIAKRKAQLGTSIKMRPTKIVQDGMVVAEKFIMLVHTLAGRDLKADTTFNNAQRDMIQGGKFNVPLLTGSDYLGEWDGVMVYSSSRVPLESSGVQIAHNFFLGAQACFVGVAQRLEWAEDIDDYYHENGFAVGEVRGIAKTVYDRSTPEDNGVVHVYTAAVAD